MDLNFKRRARERRIAAEVANELYQALKPAIDAAGPAADAKKLMDENRGLMAHIFGLACDRHDVATEAEGARIFSYIKPALADLQRRFDHVNRQFAKLDEVRPAPRAY